MYTHRSTKIIISRNTSCNNVRLVDSFFCSPVKKSQRRQHWHHSRVYGCEKKRQAKCFPLWVIHFELNDTKKPRAPQAPRCVRYFAGWKKWKIISCSCIITMLQIRTYKSTKTRHMSLYLVFFNEWNWLNTYYVALSTWLKYRELATIRWLWFSNLGMIDANRELFGSEAAKDEAVWGTDPCTRQHGEHGLRHHGHVDDHQISFLYPILHQDSR